MKRSMKFLLVTFLLLPASRLLGQQPMTLQFGSKTKSVVPVFSGDQDFVVVAALAELMGVKSFFNHDKQKIVLYLPKHQIKVTGQNAFVVIDEKQTHQLPVPTLFIDGRILVPIVPFSAILNTYSDTPLLVNGQKAGALASKGGSVTVKEEQTVSSAANLTAISGETRLNGLLIHVTTEKPFQKNDLEIWKNKSWVYVTVSGGLAAAELSESIKTLEKYKLIKRALVFQNKNSVQLSFQLTGELTGQEILAEEKEGAILIVLRVKDPKDLETVGSVKTGQNLLKEKEKWKIDKIVLDAGHGGVDAGASGKKGIKEKDITLAIILKLGRFIDQRLGIGVEYTRTTDTRISLKKRTQFANARNAKLFVSVHCNSSKSRQSTGFETFFLSPSRTDEALAVARKENEVIQYEEEKHDYGDFTDEKFILANIMQSVFVQESEELAAAVQKGLSKQLTIKNRGVSQAPFYVLMGASMPSILVETAFISNPAEEKFLNSEEGQNKLAEGIYEGIRNFIKANDGK